MPDSNKKRKKVFLEYDTMTDEQLRRILREDAEKTEGEEEMDQERLLYIMEVLVERRKKRNEAKDPHAAWESFQKYYAAKEDSAIAPENPAMETKGGKNSRKVWKRGLVAAAAAVALFISGVATVGASRQEVQNVLPVWTRDHFYFITTEKIMPETWVPNYDLKYASVQEALDDFGIEQRFVPTWLPEGFKRIEVDVHTTYARRHFYEAYLCGDDFLSISIVDYLPSNPSIRCQGGGLVEIYEANGVNYYLYRNNSSNMAGWYKDGFECTLGGDVTMEELKKMIVSIEGG